LGSAAFAGNARTVAANASAINLDIMNLLLILNV
jgi:hypothetical protein